jgi:hypothetical protein
MTEDEARSKWCPMTRLSMATNDNKDVTGFNRIITSDGMRDNKAPSEIGMCVASKCMLWRWDAHTFDHVEPSGYCGLSK